jgi:ACS family glucarate transporter-like MFS transporter/ACS family D-galactonate transporter-like MFS transporter
MILISAGSFCAAFAGPCAYTATIDLGGSNIPMVFSVMNMSGNIGAAICPMVVPLVVRFGDENWNLVLLFFAAIYLAAAIAWAFLDPTRPVFAQAEKRQTPANR